jgi:hypothetical protein
MKSMMRVMMKASHRRHQTMDIEIHDSDVSPACQWRSAALRVRA